MPQVCIQAETAYHTSRGAGRQSDLRGPWIKAIGNGVAQATGRAIARAVLAATAELGILP
jgi:hypothetical protein